MMLLVSENEWHLRADFGCPPPYSLTHDPAECIEMLRAKVAESSEASTYSNALDRMIHYSLMCETCHVNESNTEL